MQYWSIVGITCVCLIAVCWVLTNTVQMAAIKPNVWRHVVLLVSAGSKSEAEKIARSLVEGRLAACVNMKEISSIYRWQGEIHADNEWQLMIKTESSKIEQIEQAVKAMHSYELPEIITLPIVAGYAPYLDWISAETSTPST